MTSVKPVPRKKCPSIYAQRPCNKSFSYYPLLNTCYQYIIPKRKKNPDKRFASQGINDFVAYVAYSGAPPACRTLGGKPKLFPVIPFHTLFNAKFEIAFH
jgi:hypothetical protein